MRTEQQIKEGLAKSEVMFEKYFGELDNLKLDFARDSILRCIKKLVLATEICTLKWTLGKSKLNCYDEKKFAEGILKEIKT